MDKDELNSIIKVVFNVSARRLRITYKDKRVAIYRNSAAYEMLNKINNVEWKKEQELKRMRN